MLDAHLPADALEADHLRRMRLLIQGAGDPFSRDHFEPGHFTASAFVFDPGETRVLLIHHAKLGRWLQPGGHIDPEDGDVVEAVRRELEEETGQVGLERIGEGIFDVDVHEIPARKQDPAHEHFDLRFLFRAAREELRAGDDALDARWVELGEIASIDSDESVMRAVEKLRTRPWRHAYYWQKRFGDGEHPWELGEPSPTLLDLAHRHLPPPDRATEKPAYRVLVPGCGRGDDALALARMGHEVTALDWSQRAIQQLHERAEVEGLAIETLVGSAFELPEHWQGRFDAWVEHTFFCAIDPSERDRYARAAGFALRPGGVFLGAVFLGDEPETESGFASAGPPFLTPREDFEHGFAGAGFVAMELEPSEHAPPKRRAVEFGAVLRRLDEAEFVASEADESTSLARGG
jgi:8-oxo-dGTP pyrophosphatase MutT (NUDIX family)